jgi:hypothetical protein
MQDDRQSQMPSNSECYTLSSELLRIYKEIENKSTYLVIIIKTKITVKNYWHQVRDMRSI